MELTNDIKDILENLVHWDTCPQDYKDKINNFLKCGNGRVITTMSTDDIEVLPCVMSPDCEIIRVCSDEDVANKVMGEFVAEHGQPDEGEWYVDLVKIDK